MKHRVHKSSFTLLFIDVVDLNQIIKAHDRTIGDQVLMHVARYSTAGLRLADILFRYGNDEFVALLNDASMESARSVADRIREGLRCNPLSVSGQPLDVKVSVIAVSSPGDGDALPDLVETAQGAIEGVNPVSPLRFRQPLRSAEDPADSIGLDALRH